MDYKPFFVGALINISSYLNPAFSQDKPPAVVIEDTLEDKATREFLQRHLKDKIPHYIATDDVISIGVPELKYFNLTLIQHIKASDYWKQYQEFTQSSHLLKDKDALEKKVRAFYIIKEKSEHTTFSQQRVEKGIADFLANPKDSFTKIKKYYDEMNSFFNLFESTYTVLNAQKRSR